MLQRKDREYLSVREQLRECRDNPHAIPGMTPIRKVMAHQRNVVMHRRLSAARAVRRAALAV